MNRSTATPLQDYPWYAADKWEGLEQGDILLDCPVLIPTEELTPLLIDARSDITSQEAVGIRLYDLVIMSQSCDLAQDNIDQVLLCAFFPASNLNSDKRIAVMKERMPSQHMIEACVLNGHEFERQVIDFRTIYTLPKAFVSRFVEKMGKRIRLLPPYREHLSQSFARYFMRVGLPRPLK